MSVVFFIMIKIYFKTDKNFRKTQQLFKNNRVAMCFNGTQVEGIAVNKGLVVDEPGRVFEKKYKEYLDRLKKARDEKTVYEWLMAVGHRSRLSSTRR